jgi:beta-barrel assembly-enhancing protease
MSMPSDGARFAGLLSNGASAAAKSVAVRFAGGGLELRVDGETRTRIWPYDQLRSSVPLRSDATDALLSLQPDGAETLFVANPSFASVLLPRVPSLSPSRQRWRGLKPGLAVLASVVAIVGALWAFDLHPAQAVARVMPPQSRQVLGHAVVGSLAKDRKVCETPASRAALDRLTKRLIGAASDTPIPVRVTLFDWGLVNAFAAPGGQIILTRGLVQLAGSSDEVAGVLAHEIGHTLELHPEVGLIRAVGLSAAAQLAFAGSSGTISNVGVVLTQLRYTRIAEREADAHALRILKGAGISQKGFGDFFERLEAKGSANAPDIAVLSTHPVTAERIAMVRAQAAYPATAALSAEDWRALREACGAPPARPPQPATPAGPRTASTQPPAPSSAPAKQAPQPAAPTTPRTAPVATPTPSPAPAAAKPDPQADREIAEATKALEANSKDFAALQKRARAYARKNQHEAALADYVKAADIKPDDAALHYGRGTALQNLRRYEEALSAYDAVLRLAPTHNNARNNRGNVNRVLKRYDAALQDFDELIRTQPDFVHALYNRGLVYREMDRLEESVRDFTATIAQDKAYTAAYTSRGLSHEKMGARDKAIEDFRTALAVPEKYNNGGWAHTTAREHLKVLGADAP